MVQIIDYGSGNTYAIQNAYLDLNIEATIVSKPEELNEHKNIILPGVGEFDSTVRLLKERDFWDPLDFLITEKKNTHFRSMCWNANNGTFLR